MKLKWCIEAEKRRLEEEKKATKEYQNAPKNIWAIKQLFHREKK
jgi:hypothetical protein